MTSIESTPLYEDLDVFTIPHNRMKHLLVQVNEQFNATDFSNSRSFGDLLVDLLSAFGELKKHEEIENKYIMGILKRRLRGEALQKLLVHLHAHSHISQLLKLVKTTQRELKQDPHSDLHLQGMRLNRMVGDFYEEYVPHMVEEEQVLQPLLVQFVSANELRHIKDTVLKLHQLKDLGEKLLAAKSSFDVIFGGNKSCPVSAESLLEVHNDLEDLCLSSSPELAEDYFSTPTLGVSTLSDELLVRVLSYLGPKDLSRCAQVSHKWSTLAYDRSLWQHLHITRWGTGDWRFSSASSDDCNCDCAPNYEMAMFLDDYSDASNTCSHETDEDVDVQARRESRILIGLSRFVLPKVGTSVKSIVVECSKAISNGMLYRLLCQCPNLEYFDASQTIISDLGIMGLFKGGGGHCLKHFDVSGCRNITDKVLIKLSNALGKHVCASSVANFNASGCRDVRSKKSSLLEASSQCVECSHLHGFRMLEIMRLSGCYQVTNLGLRALSKHGGLPHLRHLDLSGCINLSGSCIEDLVSVCPKLDPSELFYCDNIVDGPCPETASGCQNCECLNRVCCRQLENY